MICQFKNNKNLPFYWQVKQLTWFYDNEIILDTNKKDGIFISFLL